MKLLAVILIGWLAVAEVRAQSRCFSWLKRRSAENMNDHFNKLNSYLIATIPDDDSPQKNLALIRSNIDHQLTGGVKVAAKMLLDVTDFGDQCNNNVLAIMLELEKTDLRLYGQRRVEKLLRVRLAKGCNACANHIELSIMKTEPDITKFFREFFPYGDTINYRTSNVRLNDHDLYEKLKELASESGDVQFETEKYDEQAGKSVKTKDRAKFDRAFDHLFVKSCERVISNDELVDSIVALGQVRFERIFHPDREFFLLLMDEHLRDMNWMRTLCNRIINMGKSARTRIYRS